MSAFDYNGTKGIDSNGNVTKIPVPTSTTTPKEEYASEDLSKLMNGIGYGREYAKMKPYNQAGTGNTSQNKYWNTLQNNVSNTGLSNTMTIQKAVNNTLTVQLNGIADYYVDPSPVLGSDKHLYLQSHHGSGVIFTTASLQLN